MKLIRISAYAVLGIILLLLLSFFGLRSGSFEYQGHQEKEFAIDAPLSEICGRAMRAKALPKSENGAQVDIDIPRAAKSLGIGEPISCEIDHPKLGKMNLKIKLSLNVEDGVFLKGETVSIEPNIIRKKGLSIAEINAIRFTIGIVPKDFEKKPLTLLPDTGTTTITFSSSTDLKIYFREFDFIRNLVDKEIVKSQQNILKQINAFIETNLRNPADPNSKTIKDKLIDRFKNKVKDKLKNEQENKISAMEQGKTPNEPDSQKPSLMKLFSGFGEKSKEKEKLQSNETLENPPEPKNEIRPLKESEPLDTGKNAETIPEDKRTKSETSETNDKNNELDDDFDLPVLDE